MLIATVSNAYTIENALYDLMSIVGEIVRRRRQKQHSILSRLSLGFSIEQRYYSENVCIIVPVVSCAARFSTVYRTYPVEPVK